MPNITVTITREQRDAIHELVVEHLGCLGDLRFAIDHGDIDTAKRLAGEFNQDIRLLDDLGWGVDERLEVPLTVPSGDLAATFRRLRRDAKGALSEPAAEREAREADEASLRRYRVVLDTASELLIALSERGPA